MKALEFSHSDTNTEAKIVYQHKKSDSRSTAYELSESIKLILQIPRCLGATSANIRVLSESFSEEICLLHGKWSKLVGIYDEYVFEIKAKLLGVGLYFFRPEINVYNKTLYGAKRGADILFGESSDGGLFQLSICDFKYDAPKKLYGGIIYHIFVDRFRRSANYTPNENAIVVDGEWDIIPEYPKYPGAPLKNNTFYGGTIWGIIEKLDYIQSLGVTAIYLSPIFESVSNHKYDTADYMTVDKSFGGDEALSALISECNKRNIYIILDGVFNHTGDDSVFFNKKGRYKSIGAYQSKDSPYYSWYDFQEHPSKYTCWWDIDILPRINPDVPECGDYFLRDGGVISKYSDMGIYGFRLDVADELSDAFISKIKARLSTESVLYGEVWEDASNKISYGKRKRYFLGNELDAVMNYPIRKGLINYALGHGTSDLHYALTDVLHNAPDRVLHAQMNLLGTHDTERILTLLGGEDVREKNNDELSVLKLSEEKRIVATKKLCSLYTVLATLPGVPSIFYGDEAGLEGYGDPFNRMPYPWGKEDKNLVYHYINIGRIRSSHSIYKNGAFELLHLSNDCLVFSRTSKKQAYITVFNNSDTALKLEFAKRATALLTSERKNEFTLPPYSANVYKTTKANHIKL